MNQDFGIPFIAGLVTFVLLVIVVLVGAALTPHDPNRGDLKMRLLPPLTPSHPLGTDALGRDVATRLLYGSRISLYLASSGVILSMLVGVTLGLVAGFLKGPVDAFLMRAADVQLAFPFMILALTILTAVPPSNLTLIVLLALSGWVLFARTVRGSVLKETHKEYVEAATVLGASRRRIALRYVLPNLIPTIAVLAMLELAAMIMFESTMSFLGVGIQPPTASLGGMMLEGQTYMRSAWWVTVMPAIAIFVIVFSLSLISEGLRSVLDPRSHR